MFRIALLLLVGTFVWALGGAIKCPDGNTCSDYATCCRTTHGYRCCPYPKAVCCSDLAHCCPSGFRCNLVTEMCEKADQPWLNIPMVKKEAGEEVNPIDLSVTPFLELKDSLVPEQKKASVVHCDSHYTCPDGTTCCRHPKGVWFCCPYSPGRCCLDGYHCCPYGYDCDLTYTHCVRQSLRYPFPSKQALSSVPASHISTSETDSSLEEAPVTALTEASSGPSEDGVIWCDSKSYCSPGSTCCKGPTGKWSCCPYPLGQCCADGRHCCQYGYTCDPTSLKCRRWYAQVPSGLQEEPKEY